MGGEPALGEALEERNDSSVRLFKELLRIRDPQERKRYLADMSAKNHPLAMTGPRMKTAANVRLSRLPTGQVVPMIADSRITTPLAFGLAGGGGSGLGAYLALKHKAKKDKEKRGKKRHEKKAGFEETAMNSFELGVADGMIKAAAVSRLERRALMDVGHRLKRKHGFPRGHVRSSELALSNPKASRQAAESGLSSIAAKSKNPSKTFKGRRYRRGAAVIKRETGSSMM